MIADRKQQYSKGCDVSGLYGASPENGRPTKERLRGRERITGVDINSAEGVAVRGRLEARKAQGTLEGQQPGDQCDEIWAFISRNAGPTALAHSRPWIPRGRSVVRGTAAK
jgi:hypothetical protein